MINQQPADTRSRIVGVAMQLFWEKGYGSTSIADILKAANANSGSLYHFFPGKQDLLIAVLDMYLAGIDEMLLKPLWENVADPIERVFALLNGYREHLVGTDCQYGCPIGYLALELHEPDPPVRERIAANFTQWVDRVETCLNDAGNRLPKSLDRRALAHFVLTTMEGAVMQARTYRTLDTFDASIGQLRSYFDALQASAKGETKR
jgi:AcrR family transcriptional regulator